MSNSSEKTGFSHLAAAFGGFLFATWAARQALADSKKSRAEIDFPEESAEAFTEISQLLDEWEPSDHCVAEDDFTQDLAQYLADNSEWRIEVYPSTQEGKPDILIDDLIALELKVDPNKNERNRCIGQCAGYSRKWITWMVIIDSSPSKIGELQRLLADKGLEHILVFDFS